MGCFNNILTVEQPNVEGTQMKKLLLSLVIAIILMGIAKFAFTAEVIIRHDNNHYTHYHYPSSRVVEKVYYSPSTVYYYPSRYHRVVRTYYEPQQYYSYSSVSVEEVSDTRYYIY